MASVATKISMLTTMVLGRQLQTSTPTGTEAAMADLIALMEGMMAEVEALKAQRDTMQDQIGDLETSVESIDNMQITNDYFYMNDTEWTIWGHEYAVVSLLVPAGETLEMNANITTHENGTNDHLWIFLYRDGWQKVATSIDDGNKKDDNASVGLLYREKTTKDTWYQLKIKGGPTARKIPATQMQISYKTYGSSYPLSVLN